MASLLRASPLAQLAEQSIASSVYDAAIIADQTSLQRFACFTYHQNAMDERFYENAPQLDQLGSSRKDSIEVCR